ncbi:swi5-dependent recombination DNA repair protein 1 homolog [Clavelina lepadiformis]|uniref:Swi5-dependent recombination DNA repair protein 1 homolog n=1 Tax=Clavelina lepadiformis TaxID=159417 RepID=A0ABP0GCQ7_CLALP
MCDGFHDEDDAWMLAHIDALDSKSIDSVKNEGPDVSENVRSGNLTSSDIASTALQHSQSKDKQISLKLSLKDQFLSNQENIRKLKLVRTHRNKNNLETLQKLIYKWREACQSALQELLDSSSKPSETTMLQLINYLGIDTKMIQFDPKTQSFLKTS